MMQTSRVGPIALARPVTGAAAIRQDGFALPPQSGATAGSPPVGRNTPTAPIGASIMLALQETIMSEAGDREARRHGQRLVAALAELQRALLGAGTADALHALHLLTETMPPASDPGLAQAIGAIRLRARLEVAKAAAASGRTCADAA